jgi:hypothetical protein
LPIASRVLDGLEHIFHNPVEVSHRGRASSFVTLRWNGYGFSDHFEKILDINPRVFYCQSWSSPKAKMFIQDPPAETGLTMENAPAQELQPEEAQVMRLILRAIREIRYGSVQIVIQDSKVVQIDKVEKLRLV